MDEDLVASLVRAISEDPAQGEILVGDISYSAVSLHDRSKHSWAVVGDLSGAIAMGDNGDLLMRMREEDARRVAVAMTAAIGRRKQLH